jgi:hypothetical protein
MDLWTWELQSNVSAAVCTSFLNEGRWIERMRSSVCTIAADLLERKRVVLSSCNQTNIICLSTLVDCAISEKLGRRSEGV